MADTLPRVELWTDGAVSGNPGPGGWAAILILGPHERELSGGELKTTNNRMELMAVIQGLNALGKRCSVHIHCDSDYVVNAFKKNWINGWIKREWRTAAGKPVANQELWEALLLAVNNHEVHWYTIKGHSGIPLNERADELAVRARRELLRDVSE